MIRKKQIPVIDIFAGPGGLGEGFSKASGSCEFDIRLSIEKDQISHRTLELRSFLRSFGYGSFPAEYYDYVRNSGITRKQLFEKYPENATIAETEAWRAILGSIEPALLHQRITDALGHGCSEWLLIGGPPCQAYSLIGRARLTGLGSKNAVLSGTDLEKLREEKLSEFDKDERHTLYKEYLRIVAVHKPTVFVMENVKGILSSRHGNQPIFDRILADLTDPWTAIENDKELSADLDLMCRRPQKVPRYRLYSFVTDAVSDDKKITGNKDFLIKSENYGIPQNRHRVIVLGILEDFCVQPASLIKESTTCSVRDAIGDLPVLRSGLSRQRDSADQWSAQITGAFEKHRTASDEPEISQLIEESLSRLALITDRGAKFVVAKRRREAKKSEFHSWVADKQLGGYLQHETRSHMASDLWRYLYISAYGMAYKKNPKVDELPSWLIPKHRNLNTGSNKESVFRDRFKVQLFDRPAGTITSHISKDGHYYIHPDPAQCRSLTVREAARLQSFPDNYFFEGNRTQQYHQIGNAVPPLLAEKLAKIVADLFTKIADRTDE